LDFFCNSESPFRRGQVACAEMPSSCPLGSAFFFPRPLVEHAHHFSVSFDSLGGLGPLVKNVSLPPSSSPPILVWLQIFYNLFTPLPFHYWFTLSFFFGPFSRGTAFPVDLHRTRRKTPGLRGVSDVSVSLSPQVPICPSFFFHNLPSIRPCRLYAEIEFPPAALPVFFFPPLTLVFASYPNHRERPDRN